MVGHVLGLADNVLYSGITAFLLTSHDLQILFADNEMCFHNRSCKYSPVCSCFFYLHIFDLVVYLLTYGYLLVCLVYNSLLR